MTVHSTAALYTNILRFAAIHGAAAGIAAAPVRINTFLEKKKRTIGSLIEHSGDALLTGADDEFAGTSDCGPTLERMMTRSRLKRSPKLPFDVESVKYRSSQSECS